MPDERFTILFVCTGNICRSPIAEVIARQRLDTVLGGEADRVAVGSVGAQALAGESPVSGALEVLAERGLDGGALAARQLNAESVDAADLVLTAGRGHRSSVVTLVPSAVEKTFTLREFARLAEAVDSGSLPDSDPVGRAHALVRAAGESRDRLPAAESSDRLPAAGAHADDVADPLSGDIEEFRACARAIEQALEPLSLLGR